MKLKNTAVLKQFLSEQQIRNLKPHDMGRSWAFEPYLAAKNADAQNAIDSVLDDVCAEWAATKQRKPSPSTEEKFIDCGRAILSNLLRARSNKIETTIGTYRSKDALDRERQYRPDYMTTNRLILVQDWLCKTGHIEIVKKGFNLPGYSQTSRFALTNKGATELDADDWSIDDFAIERGKEPIRLKDADNRLISYSDTPNTAAMRERLAEINTRLALADIGTTTPLTLHDRKPEYQGRNASLHRVFNRGDFNYGGRFVGGWWQNIRSSVRRRITIDGKRTIEADFSGFNPSALLAEAGLPIPDDPYASIVGVDAHRTLRDHAKATLAALLNAKSGRTDEPRNFDHERWGMSADDFRNKVLEAFPMVPQLLGTDKGLLLQRQESDLAERIMLHFVRQGHAILPIHDAFIVQADLEAELLDVMKNTFELEFGQAPSV